MNPVLFYSKHLRFFFKKGTSTLIVWDRDLLPHSVKFLYSVYPRYNLERSQKPIPRVCYSNNPKATLILNLNSSILVFPIKELRAIRNVEMDIYTTYNERIYQNLKGLTEKCARYADGESRVATATGAILHHCADENEKENIKMAIGLLSVHSPQEIVAKYM